MPGQDLDSWQLIEREDRRTVSTAGAAFSPLFRFLPGGGPLARLTDRFPSTAERGYRLVADRRSAIGRVIPAAVKRWADRVIEERTPSESPPDGR